MFISGGRGDTMEYPDDYAYLTPDEAELIERYRMCSPEDKAAFERYLMDLVLAQDEPEDEYR